MGWFVRLGLSILGLSGVLVIGTIIIGSTSPGMIAIYYHENEGEIFTLRVEDMDRHSRLKLAGTRCFGPLPPWVYSENPEARQGAPDVGRTTAWGSADGSAVVTRLRCR